MTATSNQLKYIEILLIDVGIGINRAKRNIQLSLWLGRDIHYLDELSKSEASLVIDKLKEVKGEEE